ncbi:putative BsuMI modification methylase subunit YdiO [Methanolapillus millepedarum]|uniref:DNA (cytosine-5-)-methyltransferase n=2 Tax=Methanolapillus millepedarum TaxID=3028296 RepID=A0AA96ZVZ9_9EURY|nr:putative BsuMI modification methylase subunit YdiO [Methanosarcinaceae archaeon Ac7]
MSSLKAVDFFCGSGGMTCGFRKAGVKVLAGIDIEEKCRKTYEFNNEGSKFIHANIKELTFEGLEKEVKISQNDNDLIFIGCSPCQYWSVIATKKEKSSETKNLLVDFQRFVDHYNPGYVVIENVPGMLTRKDESPLDEFLKYLSSREYSVVYDVVNVFEYGVPQSRKRFILIASRLENKNKLKFPEADTKKNPPTVRQFIGTGCGFKKIPAGHKDDTDFNHTCAGLGEKNMKRLRVTPHDGGTRMAWKDDKELQLLTYIGRDNCFKDSYGRMFWDKPGPTITTKFFNISNGRFAHPEQNRPISIREGATLQTFDKDYLFFGTSLASNAKMIGNAVPPELSKRIANMICTIHQ